MKSRKLAIGLLVMLALVVTTGTFAFWASGINGNTANNSNTIQIGTGDSVTTTVAVTGSASSALDLVPSGREEAGVSVSSITFTFDVTWAGASDAVSAAGSTGTLNITPVLSGADASELALFTVPSASTQAITYGDTATITITVEFTQEPADFAQYQLIANATLTLDVTFLVDGVTFA